MSILGYVPSSARVMTPIHRRNRNVIVYPLRGNREAIYAEIGKMDLSSPRMSVDSDDQFAYSGVTESCSAEARTNILLDVLG